MSDGIIKVLNELCSKFGIAIDWTSDNVVPYLQDLMTRYAKYICYTSIMWLAIGVLIVLVVGIIWYKYYKSSKDIDCGIIVLILCGMLLGGMTIVVQTLDIIEVLTIPEKAIVEDVRYMLENND